MEKKKQKIQEQQARRREEQEQKRLAVEMEISRKREAQKYTDCHYLFIYLIYISEYIMFLYDNYLSVIKWCVGLPSY